jgi:hypothetical protein
MKQKDVEQIKRELKFVWLMEPTTLERAEQICHSVEEALRKYPHLQEVLEESEEKCPNCGKSLCLQAELDADFGIICKRCGCVIR